MATYNIVHEKLMYIVPKSWFIFIYFLKAISEQGTQRKTFSIQE